MPAYTKHQSQSRAKIALVGEPGAGKTSMIASLANAGYQVRVLDFDNGLDVLNAYLKGEGAANIHYVTLVDDPARPKAFDLAKRLVMREWIDPETQESLGKVSDWDNNHVLVIDGASFMCDAAIRKALSEGGKPSNSKLSQPDWGDALRHVQELIAYVTSEAVKCNFILIAHTRRSSEDGPTKEMPSVLTGNFSARVGGFFNNVFRVEKRLVGKEEKVVIKTRGDPRMELKSSAPDLLKPEEEPDLANIINKLTRKS